MKLLYHIIIILIIISKDKVGMNLNGMVNTLGQTAHYKSSVRKIQDRNITDWHWYDKAYSNLAAFRS